MKILTVVVIVFALLMLPNHIVFLWFDFGDGGNIPLHKATYRKPRANERNIACQQLNFGCYMLRPCYMLLRVTWSCCAKFETGQTFENNSQHFFCSVIAEA